MTLGNSLKSGKNNLKKTLVAGLVSSAIFLSACGGGNSGGSPNPGPSPPPTSESRGDLFGKVLSPFVSNNRLSYEEYQGDKYGKGACVSLLNNLGHRIKETNTIGGWYSLNDLPTGVAKLRAATVYPDCSSTGGNDDHYVYRKDEIPTIVIKNSTVMANDLKLKTHWRGVEQIVYGKVYDENGNPFANKYIYLENCENIKYPWSRTYTIDSTKTSPDGSYAFLPQQQDPKQTQTSFFVTSDAENAGSPDPFYPSFKFEGSTNWQGCSTSLNKDGPLNKDLIFFDNL